MTHLRALPLLILLASSVATAKDNHRPGEEYHAAFHDIAVEVDSTVADIVSPAQAHEDQYRILFINRCEGGVTITRGFNDSVANTSSIIDQTRTFPPYPGSDEQWEEVMAHVRDMFLPYGIVITDEDPGNVPHTEIIACGDSFRGRNVLGVAPFACGVVQNAVGYAFAENHRVTDTRSLAETIAHEAGHTYSLNHLLDCADPMTYLNGCGNKYFQDADLSCAAVPSSGNGWVEAPCSCGGTTQNSHETLISAFGQRDVAPPSLTITAPMDKQQVEAGFPVRAEATSDVSIDSARLFINGNLITEVDDPPWVFNAPSDLDFGTHEVTVEVEDQFGTTSAQTIQVILGEPCACADAEVCVDGVCISGPGEEGGFGWACAGNEECDSGICAQGSDGGLCTARCGANDFGCPSGYSCVEAGTEQVCWPEPSSDGGCSASQDGGRPGSLAFLLFGLTMFGLTRRRRA